MKFKAKKPLALALTAIVGSLMFVPLSFAADDSSFVIDNIQVRGLNRVTVGAVLLAMPVRQGDVMNAENSALTMRRLYETGNFDDISLSREGNTVIVNVKERPTIGNIEFAGNSQLSESALRPVIEQQGLKAGEALNVQTLSQIQKSLEDFYHSAGMYQAKVKPVLTYLPRNRVDIKLEFTEGVSAEIEQINIVGNKSFDEDVLLAQMQLRDDVPWWNFLANRRYESQKFSADLESLRSYYMDRGYVRFKIDDTSVEMTPDRKGLYLTIAVTEGDQYTVGKTSLRGDTLKYGEQMKELLNFEEGEVYSAAKVASVEKALSDYLGKYGYAYSRVRAFPTFDDENKVVNLDFNVEPGSRVYVSQINITGNTSTDDTVIRRELRQMDGTWLSNEAVDLSEARLNRTGFFETVELDTKRAGNTPDTVNLDVKVKEQPTGSISGGIGYGTNSGMLLQAGISQNNVFGWGSRASIMAYDNDYRQHIELGYTDPYFTVDRISLGGRVYYDKFEGDNADVVSYDNETVGIEITSGYPLNETMSVSYSVGFEQNKIDNTGDNFIQSQVFWRDYSDNAMDDSGTFNNFTASFGFSRNNLDRSVFPTKGSRQSFSAFATVPGSDLQYYKLSAETAHYFPLDSERNFVFTIRGRVAFGDGYGTINGHDQRLPFFNNFYLGGNDWLRGFDNNSIGPKAVYPGRGDSDTSVGGNALYAGTVEISVPTPFISEAYKRQVRTSFFLDVGALWDTREDDYKDYMRENNIGGGGFSSDNDKMRASVGVSLNWMSPIGPLVFSLAKPIKDYSGDDSQTFNFNIGGRF